MAQPVVQTTTSGKTNTSTTNSTSGNNITYPSGIATGDLLILVFGRGEGGQISSMGAATGWTSLNFAADGGNKSSEQVYYKTAGATEVSGAGGAFPTVTFTDTSYGYYCFYRIDSHSAGNNPEVGTAATGSSTAPRSPNTTASWTAADDMLAISLYACDDSRATAGGGPTAYAVDIQDAGGPATAGGNGLGFGSGHLGFTADNAEFPPAWTIGRSTTWVAQTVLVRGATGTVAMTGVSGTAAVGTLAHTASVALSGNAGTGAVGTLTPEIGFGAALTGVAGSGAVGTFGVEVSVPLIGEVGGGETLTESYTQSQNGNISIGALTLTDIGECFTATVTGVLTKASFQLANTLSRTGSAQALLYAVTGAVGSTAVPTGTALASSATVAASTFWPLSPGTLLDFTFTDNYTISAGTAYCIVFHDVSLSGGINFYTSTTGAYAGNRAEQTSGVWSASSSPDAIFRVYQNLLSTTGYVGTLAPSASSGATAALTGVVGTGAAGTLSPILDIALTGVVGTGAVGTLTPDTAVPTALTGVAGTGAVGTLTPDTAVTAAITGVAGTGDVGTLTPDVAVSAALTGVAGTGAAGTLTPSTGTVATLTGVEGTGAVGTLAVTLDVALTGVSATGAAGTLAPDAAVSVALTGVAGTGAAGTIDPTLDIALTSAAGTGTVGALAPTLDVALTGIAGTGAVGTLTPDISTTVALTGVNATGAQGSFGVVFEIPMTGVGGTGAAGLLSVGGVVTVALTGVQATGGAGRFRYYTIQDTWQDPALWQPANWQDPALWQPINWQDPALWQPTNAQYAAWYTPANSQDPDWVVQPFPDPQ